MPFPRASQVLSRFTVLDLTGVRAGPTCVRQLADWGANVIKIDALMEDAGGEQPGGPRHGSDFQNLHRNKRAMTLNLKDPRGLEVFRRLAEKADVVVENFRPDVKTKLGIDYESVRKINPRIVYGSISGFGQDGPYHKRPDFDQIAQGIGGYGRSQSVNKLSTDPATHFESRISRKYSPQKIAARTAQAIVILSPYPT